MICRGCGCTTATRWRMSIGGVESCDRCSHSSFGNVPDVYFNKPYLDPHLVDTKKPEQKDGVWIRSRQHKAELMRKLGVREAGDRRHGARVKFDPRIKDDMRDRYRP